MFIDRRQKYWAIIWFLLTMAAVLCFAIDSPQTQKRLVIIGEGENAKESVLKITAYPDTAIFPDSIRYELGEKTIVYIPKAPVVVDSAMFRPHRRMINE